MRSTLFIIVNLLLINVCVANTNTNSVIKANVISDIQRTTENLTHVIAGKLLDGKVGKIVNAFVGGNWIGDIIHGRFSSNNFQIPLISDTPSPIEVNIKSQLIKKE